jgi:hypothetical protein
MFACTSMVNAPWAILPVQITGLPKQDLSRVPDVGMVRQACDRAKFSAEPNKTQRQLLCDTAGGVLKEAVLQSLLF